MKLQSAGSRLMVKSENLRHTGLVGWDDLIHIMGS